jgi:hypothetical protein
VDRFDLYELCVQSPAHLVPFLRAVHGRGPRILGEDFCGTGAISRAWIASIEGGRAIAVDRDAEALARARCDERITVIEGDVRTATDPTRHSADVIFAGNFSIGELADRGSLIAYFRHVRARLRRDGVFVCDTYSGASAFRTGAIERMHASPDGAMIRYTWEQRGADPLTARVENALHFRVERAGEIVQEITDAFVYRWRLWSVPEVRDALAEAGFASSEVYSELPREGEFDSQFASEVSVHPADGRELAESFIVCVAGRK